MDRLVDEEDELRVAVAAKDAVLAVLAEASGAAEERVGERMDAGSGGGTGLMMEAYAAR